MKVHALHDHGCARRRGAEHAAAPPFHISSPYAQLPMNCASASSRSVGLVTSSSQSGPTRKHSPGELIQTALRWVTRMAGRRCSGGDETYVEISRADSFFKWTDLLCTRNAVLIQIFRLKKSLPEWPVRAESPEKIATESAWVRANPVCMNEALVLNYGIPRVLQTLIGEAAVSDRFQEIPYHSGVGVIFPLLIRC